MDEIRREYDRLDRLCGVDTSSFELVISRRSIRRLGSFRYPAPGTDAPPRITISEVILDDDEQFWDTVRHEYAHAVVWLRRPGERHGHDEVWKSVCREIGCVPKGTAPSSEQLQRVRCQNAKYRVSCRECGMETYYLRAGRIVQLLASGRGQSVRCGRCNSSALDLYVRG